MSATGEDQNIADVRELDHEQERDDYYDHLLAMEGQRNEARRERDEALRQRDKFVAAADKLNDSWLSVKAELASARTELDSARQRLDRILSAPRVEPVTVALGMVIGDELGLAINAMRDAYIAAERELAEAYLTIRAAVGAPPGPIY